MLNVCFLGEILLFLGKGKGDDDILELWIELNFCPHNVCRRGLRIVTCSIFRTAVGWNDSEMILAAPSEMFLKHSVSQMPHFFYIPVSVSHWGECTRRLKVGVVSGSVFTLCFLLPASPTPLFVLCLCLPRFYVDKTHALKIWAKHIHAEWCYL